MQGAASTGAERTGSYVSTGRAATTQQMAFHGQAPQRLGLIVTRGLAILAPPWVPRKTANVCAGTC